MSSLEGALLFVSVLMIISTVASKASSRFGVPSLLFFLMIGMVAGAYGPPGLRPSSLEAVQNLGALALVFILFSGGMDTKTSSARSVIRPALVLSTLGVVIATLLVGMFMHLVAGVSLIEGCLLGAAVSSTDVAAVFTLLRSKNVGFKGRIGPLLELEAALNDPMAVFLSVGLLGLITHQRESLWGLLPSFFLQMTIGLAMGWVFGKLAIWIVNRIRLEFEGLYPVFSVGWVLFAFALTQALGGSGFLAVYVFGILVGNANLLHKRSLIHFHEGVAWLMQIAMFLVMGLLVDPHELLKVAHIGLGLSIFLVFVARPLSIFFCFPFKGFGFTLQEKAMTSWAGLRGSVPIILSTYILISRIPQAAFYFNLVFFVTFTSVLLQGTTIPFVAKLLKVSSPFKEKFRFPIEFNPTQNLRNKLIEISMPKQARAIGKSLLEADLPKDVLIVLIERQGDVVVPRGGTVIAEGDSLLILADQRSPTDVRGLLI